MKIEVDVDIHIEVDIWHTNDIRCSCGWFKMARNARSRQKWRPGDDGAQAKREAGAECFAMLCELYASGKSVSAKDFCVFCHYLSESGMQGANWQVHAQPTGCKDNPNTDPAPLVT